MITRQLSQHMRACRSFEPIDAGPLIYLEALRHVLASAGLQACDRCRVELRAPPSPAPVGRQGRHDLLTLPDSRVDIGLTCISTDGFEATRR